MNKEILSVVEAVSNEKSISREKIFETLEVALTLATKKKYGKKINIRIQIDRKSGNLHTFRRWLVVKNVINPTYEITLEAAKFNHPFINIGNYIEDRIELTIFDRITIQTAKKIIMKKVRENERITSIENFSKYKGKIITGIVKKINHDNFIIDLDNNIEAIVYRNNILPYENFYIGDQIKGILNIIKKEKKNIQFSVNRTCLSMLIELLRIEIPEINEELIEIKAVAREPGLRSKIAVKTNNKKIDPIGACIGIRGSRIQSISNELCGEQIDIILWDDNPIQLISNAMYPAIISYININKDKHSMNIIVEIKNLAKAIGRNGQNVKLASKLSGWELNIIANKNLN